MGIWVLLFLFVSSANAAITQPELSAIFDAVDQAYQPELKEYEELIFNKDAGVPNWSWWDSEVWLAKYHQFSTLDDPSRDELVQHYIWVHGGLAKTQFMTVIGMTQVVCHEMGHGFGGAPYKNNGSTSEGQSDYYSTFDCMRKVLPILLPSSSMPLALSLETQCRNTFSNEPSELDYCLLAMESVMVEQQFFIENEYIGVTTGFQTPDNYVETKINTGDTYYPSPQCRIDTLISGILKQPRPRCWYVP
jgi:hypothetical protein